ncbi:MAG: hypothetical protein ABH823_01750 [bacterium]
MTRVEYQKPPQPHKIEATRQLNDSEKTILAEQVLLELGKEFDVPYTPENLARVQACLERNSDSDDDSLIEINTKKLRDEFGLLCSRNKLITVAKSLRTRLAGSGIEFVEFFPEAPLDSEPAVISDIMKTATKRTELPSAAFPAMSDDDLQYFLGSKSESSRPKITLDTLTAKLATGKSPVSSEMFHYRLAGLPNPAKIAQDNKKGHGAREAVMFFRQEETAALPIDKYNQVLTDYFDLYFIHVQKTPEAQESGSSFVIDLGTRISDFSSARLASGERRGRIDCDGYVQYAATIMANTRLPDRSPRFTNLRLLGLITQNGGHAVLIYTDTVSNRTFIRDNNNTYEVGPGKTPWETVSKHWPDATLREIVDLDPPILE